MSNNTTSFRRINGKYYPEEYSVERLLTVLTKLVNHKKFNNDSPWLVRGKWYEVVSMTPPTVKELIDYEPKETE